MNSVINLSQPIVSVEWLHDNLNADNLVILNGTIPKVVDSNSNNKETQIVGARFFDIKKKFSDVSGEFPSTFPSQGQFTKEAQLLGINNDSAIVVYDELGIYSSARVWWLFKSFGFNNVAVLNGGFPSWKKAGFQVEPKNKIKFGKGDFVAEYQPKYMQFFDDVKNASKHKTHTILDARSSDRFKSLVPELRAGLRSGTIPNSKSLPFSDLMTDGELKDKEDIEVLFSALAKKEDHIVFSCGSGITACVLALGADISGYKNISVYDGSWTEWGSLIKE